MKLKIIIFSLTLLTWGCSDFLEESSQDEVRPSTVSDMIELLNGEALPASLDYWYDITGIFTDDVQCSGLNMYEDNKANLERERLKYGWQREMFDAVAGNNETKYWEYPYKKILGCNVVLDYVDQVSGEQVQKDNLRGEAYALRAYYYLMLVNFFGQPYSVGDPEKNLGVPLKLTMEVTEDYFLRNTVAEVYRSIEKDLLEANQLLEENNLNRGLYHMDHLTAKALLSRMYLYMENWDKSIEYAEKVLAVKPKLLDLSGFKDQTKVTDIEGVYNAGTPDEVLWKFIGSDWGAETAQRARIVVDYKTSDDLLGLYDSENSDDDLWTGDLRRALYFGYASDWFGTRTYCEVVKDRDLLCSGIRNAELYVNLAEAYTRKFMATGNDEFRVKALENLNDLRIHRYNTNVAPYVEVDIQDANELFEFCKQERRRELVGEGNHRWFDLRRWGMPELKHTWFLKPGEVQEFTLEKNSLRYALPIPSEVLVYNRELVQNP